MITDLPTLDCSLNVLMGRFGEAEVVDADQGNWWTDVGAAKAVWHSGISAD